MKENKENTSHKVKIEKKKKKTQDKRILFWKFLQTATIKYKFPTIWRTIA